MLLALDAGNTNVTIGLFQDSTLVSRWRLRTIRDQTPDEWGILLRNLFALSNHQFDAISGIVISSVVPPIDDSLAAMSRRYFGLQPLFIRHTSNTGLTILYDNPAEVGADRIVNSVAAMHKYGLPCIIVDLGTAITFDVVSRHSEYLGGIICPGINLSSSALAMNTAKLPLVSFEEPSKLIGTNTVGSIQSGLYYGAISTIDGILKRLITETGVRDVQTVATGGQASLIHGRSQYIRHLDDDLTLEGLRILWARHHER
jgi:type III pantothenate kinase